ncbi:hypothetical protein C8Q70DRAFT_1055464 [Cubamyces menziesii]|nr:hypothetical protein C8Q70DRAFT_1055464 [Cubamyces menziesii]
MSNANSQPRRGPRTRQRHASQDVWKYTSPEDYAPTNAEEERSPNASAVTSASGSQPPRSNASSRVNQLHSQQASTSSNISQGKRTATKRKRAADERSGALQGGERSSKRKRASPRLAEDELKSRRSMASPRESARSLQQAASPSVYDSHTVHWEDSYLVAYDHSSASGSQVEGPSSRPHGVIDTFPGPNVYTPFTADSLLCASASPSEVNSRPRSSPSLSTAGLQATGGAANVAGPSTTRTSPTSLLQHTLFWNQTPQDFSSSAPSQAVHDALASSPASAIGSALSDTPRSWSAASAATQSASDQPSRRAPAHAHTRDHTDRAGPSGGRRSRGQERRTRNQQTEEPTYQCGATGCAVKSSSKSPIRGPQPRYAASIAVAVLSSDQGEHTGKPICETITCRTRSTKAVLVNAATTNIGAYFAGCWSQSANGAEDCTTRDALT